MELLRTDESSSVIPGRRRNRAFVAGMYQVAAREPIVCAVYQCMTEHISRTPGCCIEIENTKSGIRSVKTAFELLGILKYPHLQA